MLWSLCFIFLLSGASCGSVHDFFNGDVINRWLFPSLGEENSLCRNHSRFYLEELDKLKLWATEMYDSSGKFPSGILNGSPFALGQFDECLDIKVPYETNHFTGKYCLTKITVTPNYKYKMKEKINFEFGDYNDFYNISAWSKMIAYSHEASKAARNEIYLSFCLPSSCTEMDLHDSLNNITNRINGQVIDFSLTIKDAKDICQVKSEYVYSAGDITFITFISFFAALVLVCSLYDMCSRSDDDSIMKKSPGKLHEILICFSVPKNLNKLASSTNNEDGLDCLAGVKVISMFLIIMGHRCMFCFGAPIVNPLYIERMYSRFEATAILNGPIIVDTFFLISGFLASYFTLSALKNTRSIARIFLIYIHRLIRMTPTYVVVLAFYCTIFSSLGSGPFWQERIGVEKDRCLDNWWANVLYINNYVNVDKLCMFQSWYIACDMHYFLLIPLLVIILKKNATLGVSAILTLMVGSILVVLVSVYIRNEDAILLLYMKLLRDPIGNPTFSNIYIPSHMRASPYFVGVMTGYIKYRMKNSAYKLPKWLYRTGWVVATFVSLATIHLGFIFYLPEFANNATMLSALYAGFHHFTFSAGNAWLIIAVSSGKGSWVEPLLSWKPFILLSRISYTAFLCHGAVQLYTAAIMREPNYATLFSTIYATFGDIVMAYSFGFVLSILFEAPIIGLEKIMFGGKRENMNSLNTNQTDIIEEVKINGTKGIIQENNNVTNGVIQENNNVTNGVIKGKDCQ